MREMTTVRETETHETIIGLNESSECGKANTSLVNVNFSKVEGYILRSLFSCHDK